MKFLRKHVSRHVKNLHQRFLGLKTLHKHMIAWSGLTALVLGFVFIFGIFASTSGPNSPTTAVDNSSTGSIAWKNPARVLSSNNSYATGSLNDNEISHYIKATGFNFSIPSGAVINGITVEVEKKAATASRIKDYSVRIVKGGTIGSTNKATTSWRGTSDSYTTYGSGSDLWGETWTSNDINNANFGIVFSATKASTTGGGVVASIDHIRITITYTLNTIPNAPTLVSPNSGSTINNNTPTLTGHYSDPDTADIGTTNYRIATSADNCLSGIVIASGTSSATTSNSQDTSWTPISSIGNDGTYYWCAQNNDGLLTSLWTSMGNFILNTVGNAHDAGVGTNVNGPGTIAWTNPSRITADDTNYATAVLTNKATSEYIQGTNYSFNIPAGATINGITVSIMRMSSSAGEGNSVNDIDLNLLKNGVITGTDKAVVTDWPTSMTEATYGGTGDLRGTTWTPAEINANNFGVSLSVYNQAAQNRTASVDYIKVKVTYTPDTTPPTADVIYSITGITNQDVIVTLTGYSEPITITNNGGSNSYTFTDNGSFIFEFKDVANNTGNKTANVTWIDKEDPVITINGESNVVVQINHSYTELGATWTDNVDGSGFLSDPSAGSVNTSTLGTYILTYGYTDDAGNYGSAQRSVEVTGSASVIHLNGSDPYIIEYPGIYNEDGARWEDNTDGSGEVTNIVSDVNTDVLGDYSVIYTYVNTSGLTGAVTRTVKVQDTTPPELTLNGDVEIHIEYGSSYAEQGASWTDNYDGAGDAIVSGSVNDGILGTYYLDYIYVDTAGNTGNIVSRTVIVEDTIAPSVTLSASNSNPTNENIHMTAQFSEDVTGFDVNDITANGTIIGFVTLDDANYVFDIVPDEQGLIFVQIQENVCTDISSKSNIASDTFSIITYDTIDPDVDIISHIDNQLINGESITITGTASDDNGIALVTVNGETASGTTSWSKTVSLNGGNNTINVEVTDNASNIGNIEINLIRIPVTSDISHNFIDSTSQEVKFDTDFAARGYIKYGIGDFSFYLQETSELGTTEHTFTLNDLETNKTYIYQVCGINNDGYTGDFSATGSFYKSQVVTSSGTTQVTGGSAVVDGTFTTGTVIISSGDNKVEIHLDGTYAGLEFVAPTILASSDTGSAEFTDSGLPNSSDGNIVRVILGTHKVGGDVGVAVNAYITFEVSNGTVGQVLDIYRSEDGDTWTVNTPDATCTLDSSLMCSFWTDHLSYFATIKETTSTTTDTNNGSSNVVSKDYCPLYGDLSPSYYDGTCAFHGSAPSKRSEEMNMAYMYSRNLGLTSSSSIKTANVDGLLTRAQMAKMMSIYAIKVAKKKPNYNLNCVFDDISKRFTVTQFYVKLACQLGLMGYTSSGDIATKFNPNVIVTREVFVPVLYKVLNDVGTGAQTALISLKDAGIITNIKPYIRETIGTAMLMLMRADNR